MKRMNLSNNIRKNKMKIEDVKKIIEECELRLYETTDIEEGGGRDVLILKDYVVKFHKEADSYFVNGSFQNLKELEIYLTTKHKNLVPVYASHLGNIICKRVNDMPLSVYMCKYDLNEEDAFEKLKKDIAFKIQELMPIIEEHNLHLEDLNKISSWGYDKDIEDIVCIDYGFCEPNDSSYSKLLQSFSDSKLSNLKELADEIDKDSLEDINIRIHNRRYLYEKCEEEFGVDITPKKANKLIKQELKRRGLLI